MLKYFILFCRFIKEQEKSEKQEAMKKEREQRTIQMLEASSNRLSYNSLSFQTHDPNGLNSKMHMMHDSEKK